MKDGGALGDLLGGVEDAAAIPARLAMLDMIRRKEFRVVQDLVGQFFYYLLIIRGCGGDFLGKEGEEGRAEDMVFLLRQARCFGIL